MAARHNKHISVDLLSRYFKRNTHRLILVLVGQVSARTCLVIAWYGLDWIRLDYEEAVTSFAGIPAWIVEIIVPLAFALIGLRYLLLSIVSARRYCVHRKVALRRAARRSA